LPIDVAVAAIADEAWSLLDSRSEFNTSDIDDDEDEDNNKDTC